VLKCRGRPVLSPLGATDISKIRLGREGNALFRLQPASWLPVIRQFNSRLVQGIHHGLDRIQPASEGCRSPTPSIFLDRAGLWWSRHSKTAKIKRSVGDFQLFGERICNHLAE
jgi:hypothetical protein